MSGAFAVIWDSRMTSSKTYDAKWNVGSEEYNLVYWEAISFVQRTQEVQRSAAAWMFERLSDSDVAARPRIYSQRVTKVVISH